MKILIEWAENKSNDWKICTVKDGNQTITDVSVNRVNKKGETFPNFDDIKPGFEVECELWKSPAGKTYMFAPRPQSAPRTGGAGIAKAMETKNNNINKIIDRKDNSIILSSTFRDATLLTVASINQLDEPLSPDEIKQAWTNWRTWLMSQFGDAGDITETQKPF